MSSLLYICRIALSLLLLLGLLCAAPAAAQGTGLRALSVAPEAASVGGSIGVGGDRLRIGGRYELNLVAGRSRSNLLDIVNGDGRFYRQVTVPSVALGLQQLELHVDGVLVDSAALNIVAPLSISFTPSTAPAGSTVAFTVSGLTDGTLSLDFDGRSLFGPQTVRAGSFRGSLVVPVDLAVRLPASVTISARNSLGKLVPRVGSQALSVQVADSRPLARISSVSTSTASPLPRQRFAVSGALDTHETAANAVTIDYFWQAADGSVQPMGAPQGAVDASGAFNFSMRTPQIGTLSARTAAGAGRVLAVTRTTDRNGVQQQQSSLVSEMNVAIDTDAAIDLNLSLVGDDGLPIVGARVDLVDADLEQLFSGNSNVNAVSLAGSHVAGLATQFDLPLADTVLGCPATRERQYTDAAGRVEFEFDLDVPAGSTTIGSSRLPAQITILPSEDCLPAADLNTPGFCVENDPAGVKFSAVIRAAFLGYGYLQPSNGNGVKERPIRLDVRVDRYTGAMQVDTCIPGRSCERQSFQRSANKRLVLPRLPTQGLALGDPYFSNSAGFKLGIESANGTDPVRFAALSDLSPFAASASFVPATAEDWNIEFQYNPGAGRGLRAASFHLPRGGGGEHIVTLSRKSGAASCSGEAGAEIWQARLPRAIAEGFRFPGREFGAASTLRGYLDASDLDGRSGRRDIELRFRALDAALVALVATPGIVIRTANPAAGHLTVQPAIPSAATQSPPLADYGVDEKRNRLDGNSGYELCIPSTAHCGALSAVDFSHRQFSRTPPTPPAAQMAAGAAQISYATGTPSNPWVTLFDKTIPLFRWYWGIPELLSAEVFADLVLRAEYLFAVLFNPAQPQQSITQAGGRLGVGILIGVDIDVLFGVLIDAGASIYGLASAELVTTSSLANGSRAAECFRFRMDFNGWLEIGCPIANPFDPTCYIPDIERSFNIIDASDGACAAPGKQSVVRPELGMNSLLSGALSGPSLGTKGELPAVAPQPAGLRRALSRHPALAIDGSGKRLLLYLDNEGRLVSRAGALRGLDPPQVISDGYGIRDTALSFFAAGQALAVWSESALGRGDQGIASAAEAVQYQRLRFALWDGTRWSAPADLTAAGAGDGQVRLAVCRAHLSRSDCLSRKVTLVFQRNIDGRINGRKGIFTADFNGSTWGAISRVDQTGSYNITPALTYQAGRPVVAWVRYDPRAQSLDDLDMRRIAVRRLDGSSAEELDLGLPNRVAQPSLAAIDASNLAISFTRAAAEDAFIGTRQAVHLGNRLCANGCRFSNWPLQDVHGRAIYGERPSLAVNVGGEAVVTFRGLAYGAVPGAADAEDNHFPDDSPGMLASTGELLQMRSPLSAARLPVLSLSRDGAWHAQPTAVLDPSNGEIVAMSVSLGQAANLAKRFAADGDSEAIGEKMRVDDGLQLFMLADLPDLAIEALSSSASQLAPGGEITVDLVWRNRGSAWVADAERSASLRLWWDTPGTRGVNAAEFTLHSLAAGAEATRSVQLRVPQAFANDERQTLRAEIVLRSEQGELDGSNNRATFSIGGLPVPQQLAAVSLPGTRFVNLVWSAPRDARIAGYRIYADDDHGQPRPLGSSFNLGFADLTARYGHSRRYRVSTYSSRGLESPLSEPIIAAPAPQLLRGLIHTDGFE